MDKSKKSDINRQEANIGTKRTNGSKTLERQDKKQRKG